jgi:osmoprotectant transport system permease protein
MNFIVKVFGLYLNRFDFFLKLFIEHIIICFIAISLISFIGVVLGIYSTRNKKAAQMILSIADFLYTIPSIALFGFLVTVTGIGNTSAIIALVIYGILPMLRSTYVGIIEVDAQVVESAVAMGSTDWQLLWKIQIPLALPFIIAGFRTMVVMTIALGGIASFIGAGGLGVAIWRGITTSFPEMTAAGSLLVAGLAISSNFILEYVERKVRKRVVGQGKRGVKVID